MKYKVSEVAQINARNLTKKDQPVVIKYLDTSNLTEGLIKNITILDSRKDKIPSRAKRKVKENDILISTVRPEQKHYGFISKEYEDLIVSTGFAVLTPNTEIVDPYYFYKYLTMDSIIKYLQVIAENSTSAYPSITPNVIGELVIDLPDITIQKRIGRFLRNIDKKIELNYQIITNLEQLAQALFKHWFIDFEFPNENGEPYKSSGGKMVQSELGEIPEGWEIKSLDTIAHYENGLAMQKYRPDNEKESLPVLKIRELNQGYVDSRSDRCTKNIKESVKVYDGDVIFSWSGTLLVKIWFGGEAGLNQHLFKVTSKYYPKWFYYLWTKHYLERFINIASDKATTMGHIRRADLSDAKVFVPPDHLLKNFNKVFSPILDMIIIKGIEERKLSRLRDELLPKLLSGEIELPDESEVTEHV